MGGHRTCCSDRHCRGLGRVSAVRAGADGEVNDDDHPVVLFDGVCNLCNGSVQFIIAHDPHAQFRFAPLQSESARRLLGESEARGPFPDSVILIERGYVSTRSAAALRIARRLKFPWPLLYALVVVPSPLRDMGYDFIARNRYKWFGKREACMLPTPELRARFLG